MNKFIAVAALGTVSACPFEHMKHEPLFGLLEQGKNCPPSRAPKLNHMQANRLFLKNIYTGFIKGWYSENDKVVSEECFGNWIEPTIHTAWGLKKKAHEDFWSVSIDEVKSVGSDLIDAFYKNADACHFERVGDDAKHWCIENPGQCIFMENMEERIFDNVFDILGEVFDLYKLANTDDTCYSDLEQMSEINRFANDMGELAASLSGFDYKWDQSIERTHIKKKAFHTQIKDAIKSYQYNNVDPLELMFPDLAEFFQEIRRQFREFVHSIEESQKQMAEMFKPQHHEHHKKASPLSFFPLAHKPKSEEHHKEHKQVDPLADMMKMMMGPAPQQMHRKPMDFGMPLFEQPHFDMSHFKLF